MLSDRFGCRISFLNTSYVTYVRERIGDVTITAYYNNDVIGNGSDVVEVGRSVRFVASVDSGMKLRYRWRFGDHRVPPACVTEVSKVND